MSQDLELKNVPAFAGLGGGSVNKMSELGLNRKMS